ncbi:hypothetical protein C2845_PM08G11530 [Panicum miliaceum]|uniref:Uncharacterized protein n=1 Tax=Panicum miliaceum TaxID=4540 RepID=A0A3L6R166_PANMI|nr:hypothetical protein C2845_PM08G11530 [Panicum miliaceum]
MPGPDHPAQARAAVRRRRHVGSCRRGRWGWGSEGRIGKDGGCRRAGACRGEDERCDSSACSNGAPRLSARSSTAASSSRCPPSLPPRRMARGGRRPAGALVLYQRGRPEHGGVPGGGGVSENSEPAVGVEDAGRVRRS